MKPTFLLYRIGKYQDAYNFAEDIIDKVRLSEQFMHELPAIIEEAIGNDEVYIPLRYFYNEYRKWHEVMEKLKVANIFVEKMLPKVMDSIERSCGYHGKNAS